MLCFCIIIYFLATRNFEELLMACKVEEKLLEDLSSIRESSTHSTRKPITDIEERSPLITSSCRKRKYIVRGFSARQK